MCECTRKWKRETREKRMEKGKLKSALQKRTRSRKDGKNYHHVLEFPRFQNFRRTKSDIKTDAHVRGARLKFFCDFPVDKLKIFR